MSKRLTKKQLDHILIGSSIFCTGGGLPFKNAKKMYDQIHKSKKYPLLVSIDELNTKDTICCISGVGDPNKVPKDVTTPVMHSFRLLEKYIGKKITTIVPGEIGQECISFLVASRYNLKVLDADLKGGRAAPKPYINAINLRGGRITPIVASNVANDEIIIKNLSEMKKMEPILRNLAAINGAVFIAWAPGNKSFYKKHLIQATITKALILGEKVSKSEEKIATIINTVHKSKLLYEGKIQKYKSISNGKFTYGIIELTNANNIQAEIFVQNENIYIKINKRTVLTCPDLISIIDQNTGMGIHTSKIHLGLDVKILGIPIDSNWKTKQGYKLFSPRSLGYNVKAVSI